MKKYLSLLLLTSVLVIVVFGFTLMNHEAGHATGCIASAVNNMPCPENITAMSVHHIQTFISFFSVMPAVPFIFLLVLLFTVFLSAGFLFIKLEDSILASLVFWRLRRDPERQLTCPRKITRWLSLLKNSPSLHKISITISNIINLCKLKKLKAIKTTNSSIRQWRLTLSVEWSLMWIILRQAQIIKAQPTIFALSTARITLRPIL